MCFHPWLCVIFHNISHIIHKRSKFYFDLFCVTLLQIFRTMLKSSIFHTLEYSRILFVACDGRRRGNFVCLFVWSFSSHSRIFHSFGDVIFAGEGLQNLTYARNSWPLSSEGSLACHTYCDRGHPFIMVFSEDPWHSRLMRSTWQWICHYLF